MSPNFLVSPQLKEGTNGVRLSAGVRVELEEDRQLESAKTDHCDDGHD